MADGENDQDFWKNDILPELRRFLDDIFQLDMKISINLDPRGGAEEGIGDFWEKSERFLDDLSELFLPQTNRSL